jgi:hypothetical protein
VQESFNLNKTHYKKTISWFITSFTIVICRWPVYYFWQGKNLQKAVYLLYKISKEYNLEIATKIFGFVGTDHLRTKIILNDETLEQVSQFTYLGCSVSY